MLSIIVPIYNAEKYLRACLDSLAAQSYRNMEILLIDDGSSDQSSDICDEYADRYSQFTAIHKENGGCSSARNLGLSLVKGKYIAFVDADDCLDPDFYEILINALVTSNCDIAACTYVNEYAKNIKLTAGRNTVPTPVVYKGTENILKSMTSKAYSIEGFVWNKVWKRECLKGFSFREDVAIVDDAVFTWEVLSAKAERAVFVNLPMYHYRIIFSSITRNSSLDKYFKALYGYELMIKSANSLAPACLDGLCTDYIIWNIKTCEQMIFMDLPDISSYNKVKKNIERVRSYIPRCGLRHRILANRILISWAAYHRAALLIWKAKQLYIAAKRAVPGNAKW